MPGAGRSTIHIPDRTYPFFPQQFLYFFPLWHGQGSLRPTLGPVRTGRALASASFASLTTSLARPGAEAPAFGSELAVLVVPYEAGALCSARCGSLRRNCSKAIKLEALRKMLWQISLLILTMRSPNRV